MTVRVANRRSGAFGQSCYRSIYYKRWSRWRNSRNVCFLTSFIYNLKLMDSIDGHMSLPMPHDTSEGIQSILVSSLTS